MDATKKPLLVPPEFSNYAEKHGVFQTIEKLAELHCQPTVAILLCLTPDEFTHQGESAATQWYLIKQLVICQPDDPLQFLVNVLENDERVPQIVVQGPPASGKKTMSKTIAKTLGCVHINLEYLLLDLDSSEAKEAKMYVDTKKEVPTDMWISMIHERLKKTDCIKKGWVLEGFPSNRSQALALQVAGIIPKHFVLLDAPDTVLIERAVGKRIDPQTGDIYHATFDPASEVEIAMRLVPDTNSTEPVMVKRLNQYHRDIEGVLSCYKKIVKKINADQPKADVFSQVHSYLSTNQHSLAPHTPRVLLLGANGSGKSVQASLIARKYNLVNVNCDVLVKQSLTDDSKIGETVKSFMDQRVDVPDDLILQLLRNRLSQLDCISQGWVLHAFPKTRRQAEGLNSLGFEPNRVLVLDVPKDTILERLTLRSTDPQTGERYHLLYNPPRTGEVKQRLQTHPEDQEDRVTERFLAYQEHIEDITEYYEHLAQHINADQDPHTVFEYLESMIVNPLPRKE